MSRYFLDNLLAEIKTRCWNSWQWFDGLRVHLRYLWDIHSNVRLFFFMLSGLTILSLGLSGWYVVSSNALHQDINCLALNVYHEARGEIIRGQYAVAQVTMNRVASRRYPNTICGAVYQQNWDRIRKRMVGAFSWTELDHKAAPTGKAWRLAKIVAEDTYYGRSNDLVKGSLFYHARYIKPRWAKNKKPIAHIGKHIFYR